MRLCIIRSEEHTSELQSHSHLVCRLLLEKKKTENSKYLISPASSSTPHRVCLTLSYILLCTSLIRHPPPGLPHPPVSSFIFFFLKKRAPPKFTPFPPPAPFRT